MIFFKRLLLVSVIIMPLSLRGQVTIGAGTPPLATLEVVTSIADTSIAAGIIAPRLTGDELKARDNLYTALQIGAVVYVTVAVGTTSDKTTNVTNAGYYYFDGTLWQSVKGQGGGGESPWNEVGTTNPARQNTQDIYQMGRVGIGTQNPKSSAALEVASSNKGFLPPRVSLTSTTDVTTVPSPVEGLVVYSQPFSQLASNGSIQTFPRGVYMYDGSQWVEMVASNANNSGLPLRNTTGVLVQVNQSAYITLNGYQSFGLLLQNAHATISPTYDLGNWSPNTQYATDVISNTLGDDGAMLMEQKGGGILTYWRLNFNYVLGNNPPAATRYFRVDIIDNDSGGVVFSEAIVVPGGLNTGHTAPFSIFFATIADQDVNHKGYKILFGVDTAASQGLQNNISVQLKQILKID